MADLSLHFDCMPALMGKSVNRPLAAVFTEASPRRVLFEGNEYTWVGTCGRDAQDRNLAVLLDDRNGAVDVVILNQKKTQALLAQIANEAPVAGDACLVQKWQQKKWFANPVFPAAWQKTYAETAPLSQDIAAQTCKNAMDTGRISFFFNDQQRVQAYCGTVTTQQNGRDLTWAVSMKQDQKHYDAVVTDISAWTYCAFRQQLSACLTEADTAGRLEFLRINAGGISPASCPALLAQ